MKYYTQNSQEARNLLLKLHKGQQSYALTLGSCGCGDGYAISDPIDNNVEVIICQTCERAVDGFAYNPRTDEPMPMPSEYKLLDGTMEESDKDHMLEDVYYYIKRHKDTLTKEGRYLLVQYVGNDTITIGIYEN
jgi:hypothetical protein